MTRGRFAVLGTLALLASCERIGTPGSPHDASDLGRDLRVDRGAPAETWALQGGGLDDDAGLEIVVDSSGNLIVAGTFTGAARFGPDQLQVGSSDRSIVIAKLDPDGNFLWARTLPGVPHVHGDPDAHDGLAVDQAGNIFYAGQFKGIATFGATILSAAGAEDVFVAKLDGNGAVLKAVQAGGTEVDLGERAAVDASGAVTVAGIFYGSASFGATQLSAEGTQDLFVARLDSDLDFVWARRAGSERGERNAIWAEGLAVDPDGNSYLTGGFAQAARFGTFPLRTTNSSGEEAYLTSLDRDGSFRWASSPGEGSRRGNAVASDPSGQPCITGSTLVADMDLVHTPLAAGFDTKGKLRWDRFGWALSASTFFTALEASRTDRVMVVGAFSGTGQFGKELRASAGGTDVLLLGLSNSSGATVWSDQAGGPGQDVGRAVARDRQGNLYVAGSFTGTARFGKRILTSRGKADLFIWKTAAAIIE